MAMEPRAKMNQQRSRRFGTAKEAKDVTEAALRKGEKLPDEKAFDSHCITPGSSFLDIYKCTLQQLNDLDGRDTIHDEIVRAIAVFREQEDY